MEEIYKELEETKCTVESLKKELHSKSKLADSLKQALEIHVSKIRAAEAEISKQSEEIAEKNQELAAAKVSHRELESSLRDKELVVSRLASANEKLKRNHNDDVERLEGENRRVLSALEESDTIRDELARKVASFTKEIERVNRLLADSQKKVLDAERKAGARAELAQRDEMLVELGREKGELEERMKWKSEQFRHLEEAHGKLRDESRNREKEWEKEKLDLVEEACSLRSRLDSEIRVAEDLRSRLRMCSQALAHEESRRKLLEIQVSESRALYDNVVMEFEEARLSIASLTAKRDEEIGSLRNSLATKAAAFKEMEFRNAHLEEENRDLKSELKELREEQINGGESTSSVKNLRQKFKTLEQMHKGCAEKLKAKEIELTAEAEKLGKELVECLFKLSCEGKRVAKLQDELEGCHLLLVSQKLEYEELFVVQLLLQTKFSEFGSELEKTEIDMKQSGELTEEKVSLLTAHLEKKNYDLLQAQAEIKQEKQLTASLHERLEHLESSEKQHILMQRELEMYKARLDESCQSIDRLKDEAVRKDSKLRDVAVKASEDLDFANCIIADKNSELSKMQFELQQLKSVEQKMETIKCNLEIELKAYIDENQSLRRDLDNSLVAEMEAKRVLEDRKECVMQTIEEKDMKLIDLQQQVVRLEELEIYWESENKRLLQTVDNMHRTLASVQAGADVLRQNYILREFGTSIRMMEESERFLQGVEELENVIAEMQQKYLALEHDVARFVEIGTLNEVHEKIKSAYILDHQEIQYKSVLLSELEQELASLQLKMDSEQKLSHGLRNHIHQLQTRSVAELLDKEKEKIHLEDEIKILLSNKKTLEIQAEQLEDDNKTLHDRVVQLESEKENWIQTCDLIGKVSNEDEGLKSCFMGIISKVTDNDVTSTMKIEDLRISENADGTCNSPSWIKGGKTIEQRSPLREHNC